MNARLSVVGFFVCFQISLASGDSTLAPLRSFGFGDYSAANPYAELNEGSDGALYGTSAGGGGAGKGTVFRMNKDGTGYRVLKSFGTGPGDGQRPFGAVIEGSDHLLYGTTEEGGAFGYGTVFSLSKDGSTFQLLKSFTNSDGAYPDSRLLEASDGLLYGTASGGGTDDNGSLFRLGKNGSGFAVLLRFAGTNGANPEGALIEGSDQALYGTTYSGGASNVGTVFRIDKSGSGHSVLKSFVVPTPNPPGSSANGYAPVASLVEGTNGTLYGMTSLGGTNGSGTIFCINKDSTGFQVLHSFDPTGRSPLGDLIRASDGLLYGTTGVGGVSNSGVIFRIGQGDTNYVVLNNLGTNQTPAGTLFEGSDGRLYGTAQLGGDSGDGAVFALNKDGSGFVNLRSLSASGGDGASAYAGLTLASDGALYGACRIGGAQGAGSLFSVRFDGRGYRLVCSLNRSNGYNPVGTVLEGTNGVIYDGTQFGGSSNMGTFFSVRKDGGNFTVIKSSGGSTNGQQPRAGLIQCSDGSLYGSTILGGSSGQGAVFRLGADGSGFTVLKNFAGFSADGANPVQTLLEGSDHLLYGTCYSGTSSNSGVVFKMNLNGSGYTVLRAFANPLTNGANPMSPLLEASDGKLYGTTYAGGTSNNAGTVYRLNKDGSGFEFLRAFNGVGGDGRHPSGRLVEGADGALYGTTERGGTNGWGTLFSLNKNGGGFAVLAVFGDALGKYPRGGLVIGPDGGFFGTTDQGGAMGFGTIFRYGPPIEEITGLSFNGAQPSLTCMGLPGTNYYVERTAQLGPAAAWSVVSSTNAPASGGFEVIDESAPSAGAFYRLRR